jgi:hypothetical protein
VGVAVGIGTIAGVCADQPEQCVPVSPPPPPPPPQDCYADGECKIPDAPSNVAKKPLETAPNPAPKDSHVTIDEKTPTSNVVPKGLKPGDDINLPSEGGPGGPVPNEVPTAPEPASPATGDTPGAAGNTPVTTPTTVNPVNGPDIPEGAPSNGSNIAAEQGSGVGARFIAGSNGPVTDTVGSSNSISLGRYPEYIKDAQATGSKTFNVGDEWEGMANRSDKFGGIKDTSEIWIRNQQFLDRGIAQGSTFRLASDPLDPVNEGSFFLREVRYLLSQGYTVGDGIMIPPP